MDHFPQAIIDYLDYGDPKLMEKVRKYLSENFDFHNLTPEYIASFPILQVTHKVAFFFFSDIQEIQSNKSKIKHVKIIINIIRYIFNDFFKIIKKDASNKAALDFVITCENALDDANTVHGGLDEIITAIPFEDFKDKCLDTIAPLLPKNKVYFKLLIPENLLTELAQTIHIEYSIIRAPTRFEKLLNGSSDVRITVNRLKVGYFVLLMRSLLGKEFDGKYKFIEVKGGKGFWMLLEQITYDFDGEPLANHKNYFKNLSLDMSKKNEDNKFIIKQIESILEVIDQKRKQLLNDY